MVEQKSVGWSCQERPLCGDELIETGETNEMMGLGGCLKQREKHMQWS